VRIMVTQPIVYWTCVAVAIIMMMASGSALEASAADAAPDSDTDYLTCVSDLGRLNHYYHFMLNCLIPSVLHVHSQPTRKFVLCNDDLSHKDLDMLSHYKTVLPGVNTSSDCGGIDSAKILTLPTYDDRRGSQVMRLDKDSWSTFQNHFKEMSPHNYSHDVISGKQDIILIKRLNSTASSLPTYTRSQRSGADKRSIANFDDIEQNLRATFGADRIRVVEMEKMSIVEQFWTFHDARIVIGQHGAGLANMVFTNSTTFIGVMEISPYMADSRHVNFRAFSECFQHLAKAKEAQYIKIRQEGEYGPVNVTEVIQGVKLLLMPSAGQYSFAVNETRVHLECKLPVAAAAFEAGNISSSVRSDIVLYEYYLGCLFPAMVFSFQHPHLIEVGICGVALYPFMENDLRATITNFASHNEECVLGNTPLVPYYAAHYDIDIRMKPKVALTSYVKRIFHSSPSLVDGFNCSDILVVDSSLELFSAEMTELLPVANFASMSTAVVNEFGADNVTVIKLFSLSPVLRAMYFHRAKIIVVHEGPALVNLVFLRAASQIDAGKAVLPKVVQLTPPESVVEGTRRDRLVERESPTKTSTARRYGSMYERFGIENTRISQAEEGSVDVASVLKAVRNYYYILNVSK
jgi:hypothetical protein